MLARPIRYFAVKKQQPNLIQMMPEYQKALENASEKNYPEALKMMQETISNVEKQVGPYSKFHLFLYQRIASLHMIMKDLDSVELTFQKSIEVAEKTHERINKDMD